MIYKIYTLVGPIDSRNDDIHLKESNKLPSH